jgi:DNA-3-methyladenine glycosylase
VPRPLPKSFYKRDTLTVARELLGCILVRRDGDREALRARIVEVEAYVGEEDQACHARAGRTPRTDVLYGPPGLAYVYLTYGMHHLLNAVTEPEGRPAAVLIRAAEPLAGLERMAHARGLGRAGAAEPHRLASGPAKLCQAFGLDLRHNRLDLTGPALLIEPGDPVPDAQVARSARIGCETAARPWDAMPWRFYESGSRFVTPGRPPGTKTRGDKRPRPGE